MIRKKTPKSSSLNDTRIRFKHTALSCLHGKLLNETTDERFAVLLAKKEEVDGLEIFTVLDCFHPPETSYAIQSSVSLRVDGEFMNRVLIQAIKRLDVDTVIDCHTHPFAQAGVHFSGIDDADEKKFLRYLHEENLRLNYASIVFSRTDYEARVWKMNSRNKPECYPAIIETQTAPESIIRTGETLPEGGFHDEMFDRGVRALGIDTFRMMSSGQTITVVGAGGLGSIIADLLVSTGFSRVNLIDHDNLELTNLNRITGATYADASEGKSKVEAIAQHLRSINPKVEIGCYQNKISDQEMERVVANSSFVIVATDNHSSRLQVQQLCFKYFVPFISAGVNITVDSGRVTDTSGEVILVRMGDEVCLSCLGRVNYNKVAHETHPDPAVRNGLVERGYVTGIDVKEPAVKTLNSHIAATAVDTLVKQYTEQRAPVITVYEDNYGVPSMYEDKESLQARPTNCATCSI